MMSNEMVENEANDVGCALVISHARGVRATSDQLAAHSRPCDEIGNVCLGYSSQRARERARGEETSRITQCNERASSFRSCFPLAVMFPLASR